MYKLLLLALVPAVLARIEIRIKAARPASEPAVEALGSSVETMSDQERNTFNLGDYQIKHAANLYHGGNPVGVYFYSPTPFGDVFSQYGGSPVSRTLVPVSARIVKISAVPSVVARREFINKSSYRSKFNAAIQEEVEQSTSNTWSKSSELTIGQEIEYSVDLGATEIGSQTSITYSSGWGQDRSKSEAARIGASSGVEVELEPGQAVISELTATRVKMEIEVQYAASLDGDVFCKYSEPHNGHYFWKYDVNGLMNAAGMSHKIVSTENIKVGFYTDAKITVRDRLSNGSKPLLTQKVPILVNGFVHRGMVPIDLDPKYLLTATK